MAADVITTLTTARVMDDEQQLGLFLGRIRAWQSFMQRGREGVLDPGAEAGLYGELIMLSSLLESGIPALAAVESWCGPMDGLQDFRTGTGAIEVKTTLSGGGFPAIITSLEQLDDSLIRPLFLAGVRLRLDSTGLSLPDQIDGIRARLRSDSAALTTFEARLLHAGFSSAMSAHYSRCFRHDGTRLLQVDENFPRLTRTCVPSAIRRVRYEIDLDLVSAQPVQLDAALQLLGSI